MASSSASRFLVGRFNLLPDGKEALQLSAILWLGVSGFVLIGALVIGNIRSFSEFLTLVTGTASGALIAYFLYASIKTLIGRPRWLAFIALPMAVIVCAAAQTLADYGGYMLIDRVWPTDTRLPARDVDSLLIVAFLYIAMYATTLALIWVTSANRSLRSHAARLAVAEADGLRSELEALRLKLNPHFMFNALAVAGGLVEADRKAESKDMLDRLATFLRASFDVGTGDISLDEELSIVGDYLEVERVRFPDRLRVDIDVEEGLEHVLIPSLLLQPLVENAVKYGVAPSPIPVTVSMSARILGERLLLTVEDDGSATTTALTKGSGVGLSATRARLQMRYGDAVRFQAGPTGAGYRVEIELPIDRQAASTPAIKVDTASFKTS